MPGEKPGIFYASQNETIPSDIYFDFFNCRYSRHCEVLCCLMQMSKGYYSLFHPRSAVQLCDTLIHIIDDIDRFGYVNILFDVL